MSRSSLFKMIFLNVQKNVKSKKVLNIHKIKSLYFLNKINTFIKLANSLFLL